MNSILKKVTEAQKDTGDLVSVSMRIVYSPNTTLHSDAKYNNYFSSHTCWSKILPILAALLLIWDIWRSSFIHHFSMNRCWSNWLTTSMTHSEGEITILGGESTIFHRLLSGNQTWQWEIPNFPIH